MTALAHRIDGEVITLVADAGEFDGDWTDPAVVQRALFVVVEGLRRARPDLDPHFVVALSTFVVEAPAALYLPLANDVRGIGYRHLEPAEVFRFTPGRLDGVLFMNSVRGADAPTTTALFLQELGHRWGVYVRLPDPDGTRLLGRDCAHWNHFARVDGSAMEGNPWVANGNGRFEADVPPTVGYDPAQLYLMGALPAAAVSPTTLVSRVGGPCFQGLDGGAPNPRHRPPTWRTGEPATVESDATEQVPWDAVVAHEGPRRPAYGEARARWSAVFVLLAGPADDVPLAVELVDRARVGWGAAFAEATGAALTLDTTLAGAVLAAAPGSVGFGGRCLDAIDCVAEWPRCVPTASGDRICTAPCDGHGACGAGACCVAVADSAWCAPALDPCPAVDPEGGAGDMGAADAAVDQGPVDQGAPADGLVDDGRAAPRGCAQRPGRGPDAPTWALWALLGLLVSSRRR